MPEVMSTTLGSQVSKYRRSARMSAEDLADAAGTGLTRSIIANLENGRKADLTVQQLLAVAFVLRVSPVDLVFDVRDPYQRVRLGDAAGLHPAQWLAHRWFGGDALTSELFDGDSPEGYSVNPDALRIYLFKDQLKERDQTLFALRAHEERMDDLEARVAEPRHQSLGDDREYLKRRIRDFRAELYEVERRLRAEGVDLDKPAIFSGF